MMRILKLLFAAMLVQFLCSVPTPAQQRLQLANQKQPGSLNSTAESQSTFTLQQIVDLALQNSPDLKLARARYLVAKNTAGLDHSDFLPNLYTGSGLAYSNGFPQTPGGAAPAIFQMSYQQALFDPLKRGQLHADEDATKNQEIEYENARELVIVRAASAYLELANVRHSLQLLQSEQESEQKILGVAKERAAAGLELPVTVTTDELDLAKINQKMVELQDRDDTLSEDIRRITALPQTQPIGVSEQPTLLENLASEPGGPASNVLEAVLAHSASIRESENNRLAREHLLKGARGAYWPTIGIIGEYSVLAKFNNYEQFFRAFQRNNITVGVQVVIPIFAARTSANVALARSELNVANLEVESTKNEVRTGAENQLRGLREMEAARQVAQLDLQLAQEQLQQVQAKFNQGQATLATLEEARIAENEEWLAFLNADLSKEKAQLALMQATGRLAQIFH